MTTFPAGKILGNKISIHWTFIGAVLFGIYWALSSPPARRSASFLILLFVVTALIVHELGHAISAKLFGIRVGGIVLYFFGGITKMDSRPLKTWKEIPASIGGPVSNLILSFFMLLPGKALYDFGKINLIFGLFNLLPLWPLDGGRLLRGVLSLWIPRGTATLISLFIGLFILFVFFLYGILWLKILPIIISIYMALLGLGLAGSEIEGEIRGIWQGEKNTEEEEEIGKKEKETFAQRLSKFHGSLAEFIEMNKTRKRK